MRLLKVALLAALALGVAGCSIPQRGAGVLQAYTERALPLGLANARFFADADPQAMTDENMWALYDYGNRQVLSGQAWHKAPPGLDRP